MAQGSLKSRKGGSRPGKAGKKNGKSKGKNARASPYQKKSSGRRNKPVKQKRLSGGRDFATTKMLHKSIELSAAAKCVSVGEKLQLGKLRGAAKERVNLMKAEEKKKKERKIAKLRESVLTAEQRRFLADMKEEGGF